MINTKRTTKTLIAIILIFTMISSIWIGAKAFIPGQSTAGISPTANANYITFEGTASTDSISSMQYSYVINQWAMANVKTGTGGTGYPSPYNVWGHTNLNPGNVWFNASKSLRIGMTEYGEFADQGNTGIAYGGKEVEFNNTESWASTAINQAYMVQGWVLYLNYSRFYVQRCLEAYALYSNTSAVSETARQVYSWDGTVNPTPATTITSGTLTVSGIQVLYDSATLGVARETTVITDGFYNEAVAQVTVTVIYDKTSKDAIVYYDVKIILDTKVLISINDFVFQKKYEIDLARNVNPQNWAFIHYYGNFSNSVYQDPLVGTYGYDVVQAYDPAYQYIFFDGIYPSATEYSVSNSLVPVLSPSPSTTLAGANTKILPPETTIADIPLPYGEPNTPVVTIQWNYSQNAYPLLTDFLTKAPNREIRFVDVYGMTDYNKDPNPALDANDTTNALQPMIPINQVDTEVQWLLMNVFNPTDLSTVGGTQNGDGSRISSGGELSGEPPLWVAVGQGSAATDSAGAAAVSAMWWLDGLPDYSQAPLGLFDINDTTHQGTIPYGLAAVSSANDGMSGYVQTFSNVGLGTGNDPTSYLRLGLINFAFGTYDGSTSATTPQPISGGLAKNGVADGDDYWWYPAKDPLTERWIYDTSGGDSGWYNTGHEGAPSQYSTVTWHPNGIITVGGEKANGISRYFNDFNFAIAREGTSFSEVISGIPQTMTGAPAPTSNSALPTVDFFPLSTWNTSSWNPVTRVTGQVNTFGYGAGTAIISIAKDMNGTRGITVAGWNAQDTYWAAAWTSQWLSNDLDFDGAGNNFWIPAGTVSIILQMTYPSANGEPTFTIVQDLGTITQLGLNYFYTVYHSWDIVSTGGASSSLYPAWSAKSSITDLPSSGLPHEANGDLESTWWYAKLPTTSTALIQYDS